MKLSKSIHPITDLPEKVLQFGTGVLLRGLCDYAIDKANKNGVFGGKIVVVKSTDGNADAFAEQDNLYTLSIRGIEGGVRIEQDVVCEAISRVISASSQWDQVLETAKNPQLNVIISNTTEIGLTYQKEDLSSNACPNSFPAKLTVWLLERYKNGGEGVVIVPTELIVDNGQLLKSLVQQHISENNLGSDFEKWVNEENHFCSSLVDRIVPGKPDAEEKRAIEAKLGYEDELLIKAEPYLLWAIEGNSKVRSILSFEEENKGVVVEKNIEQYRELKIRLLNAPHTLMCGLSYLAGFDTVKDTMHDSLMEKYITILMLTELSPSMPESIEPKIAQRYGREILDRYRNPDLDHKWLSITFQYTMKMRMRAIPLLMKYYEVFETVPHYFARGFAAYILFMKAVKNEDGKFYGQKDGQYYLINDDQADWFYEQWQSYTPADVVANTLENEDFWEIDLTHLNGFKESVATHLSNMMSVGVYNVASALNVFA